MEVKPSENISHSAAAVSVMDCTSGSMVKCTAERNAQNVMFFFFFVTCIEFFSRFFITVSTDLIPWHSVTGIDLEVSCSRAWKVSGAGILEILRLCV